MAQNKLGLILIYYLWISVNSSAHTKFFLGTKTWESLSTWKHEAGMSSVTHLCSLWQPPAVTPMLTQTECHHHYRKCHHQSLFSASYWSAWRGSTLMNNSQFLSRPTCSHGNKALLFPWAWSLQTASKLKLWHQKYKKRASNGPFVIMSRTVWKGPSLIMSGLSEGKSLSERDNHDSERRGWWEFV